MDLRVCHAVGRVHSLSRLQVVVDQAEGDFIGRSSRLLRCCHAMPRVRCRLAELSGPRRGCWRRRLSLTGELSTTTLGESFY